MLRLTLTLCAALLVFPAAGCNKKKTPPAEPGATQGAGAQTPRETPPMKTSAPAGVPDSMKQRVEQQWPKIEKEGEAFLAAYRKAESFKGGDRSKLNDAIDEANGHFQEAMNMWTEIYYACDDLPDAQGEACRRWLSTWNRKVDGWTKRAKALKEFSQAK